MSDVGPISPHPDTQEPPEYVARLNGPSVKLPVEPRIMEPAFTDALMVMVSEYIQNHQMNDVGGPEIERVDDNRFLYRFADVEMSITVNRVDRVIPDPHEVTL